MHFIWALDLDTVLQKAFSMYPAIYEILPPKKLCHRAIDVILESIEELKFYQQHVFIPLPDAVEAKKEESGVAGEEKHEAVV
uniref:Uncharacterized protein n=1 Tax=Panagrolaimus sp. ES5 TaxID=591445 RepID=A0AC34F044_9BILA